MKTMKPDFLLVGLGNPGKEYAHTRHNAGWLALDAVTKELGAGEYSDHQKFLCTAAEGVYDGKNILLVKPTTYMNRSGECIRKLIDFYKLDPASKMLVICDDIDLPAGTHRLRMTGGAGTHNGLKSIVETFGESFPRHRIGLGSHPEQMDLVAWVLSRLSKEELKTMLPAFNAVLESMKEVMKKAS